MKNLITLAILFASTMFGLCADYPLAQAQNTEAFTLLSASHPASTNLTETTTGNSIAIERGTTHTFQTVAGCTNPSASTITIKLSLDGSNWFTYSTLVLTNTVASTNTYSTVVGKFKYAQVSLAGTNSVATVLYLGQ